MVEGAAGRTPGDPRRGDDDVVRHASRSAAMGTAEGIGREVNLWGLCAAALAGLLLSIVGHWVVRRVGHRAPLEALASTRCPVRSHLHETGELSRRALIHRQRAHARRR
jgi:hypothetical protein